MDDPPQDVYAKCLPNHRGYPLWFPEPSRTLPSSYTQDGLQIGDVGYVSQKGAFHVLFNLCHGPNHALHQRSGVSFSFDLIPLDFDVEVDIIPNADPPGCIITSPGITQPGQTPRRAGHYEFTPSSAKGAILILPDGATSHDLPANERFRRVAKERAIDWYQTAKEHYGDNISSDSLYVITGFYKSRSWSLGSFRDATTKEFRHISVVPRDNEGAITGRRWEYTFPLDYRDGPGHSGNDNQAVFISGFKIAVRDRWLSHVQESEVQPVPAVRPREPFYGPVTFLKQVFDKNNAPILRRGEDGDVDVDHVPKLSQPFHPSDIINRYRLNKNPNDLVAVTHDSEWITWIETGKLTPEELTQVDRLEAFLSENHSLVSRPGNSKKPSTDNFQVVVTCVRAEDVVVGFRRMPVGFYVLVRFDDTKRRTKNKPARFRDSVVEWDDRIQLPPEHSAKVQLSVHASFEFSPMLGNGEVLRTTDICVGDFVDDTHLITFSSSKGRPLPCSSLLVTVERRRSDLLEAASDHDEDFDWEESSDLARLTDQGHDALLRHRDDAGKENVAASIGYFERALSICPEDHKCRAAALCNLAMAHFINCQIDRGTAKLSTSISYYREALKLRHVGHPDRPVTLLHLAEVLLYHYGKLGIEEFPGEITELASEVQASSCTDSPEHRAADLALQTYALCRVKNSGSFADIDRLIPALRQAVEDIPHDYFDKLQRFTNLVLALWIRYECLGDLRDLNESIATHEEVMRFTHMALNSPLHTQLLNERANATLASGSWKGALVTAANFAVPRFTFYRVLCERLKATDRITDASECLRQMADELAEQEIAYDEHIKWVPDFKYRCSLKLESLGDAAMSAERHSDAISHYSAALSFDPTVPQGLFIKRSKAYIAMRFWEGALNDADKVIMLDPSSPWGYERRHAALHMAGRYDDAIDMFETMLLKISQSPDPEIRERRQEYVMPAQTKAAIRKAVQLVIRGSPRVLIHTTSGRLLDKSKRVSLFESLPVFKELISSMTTHIDDDHIQREVEHYYRYATFSHTWEDNEPLFEEVVHIVVYDLEESFTHDKLQMFCKIARDAGLHWAWSDTCCINKADHYVLQEALVAMFKWYEGSAVTIVFLRGVRSPSRRGDLMRSIWNTRGWTLQEYHASKVVRFYTEDWKPYLDLDIPNHKESPEIIAEMEKATTVSAQALKDLRPGLGGIREKLRLASRRETTHIEDAAYSLLGIFSVSLPIVYGEGDHALGRLLAQLLTSSGDTSILAWTGRSGTFNSCLPASISVFDELPTSHIAEMEAVSFRKRMSSPNFTLVMRLYDRLFGLPVPSFANQRMRLPCLTFKLGPVEATRTASGYLFRARTGALGIVEIKTTEDLSRLDSLTLVHPWIDFLLLRKPVERTTDVISENTIHQPLSTPGSPTPPTRPNTAPTSRPTRLSSLISRFGLPLMAGDSGSLLLLPSVTLTDRRDQCLQFIARLKQPFGALLFTRIRQNVEEYRRVAPESLITVQVEELSSTVLNKLIEGACTLDVL